MVAQLRRHLARHQVPSPFSENARQSRRHCVCVRVCVCVCVRAVLCAVLPRLYRRCAPESARLGDSRGW